MRYALGSDATKAPTDGWDASVPTGTDAGTYHVRYKAAGDEGHADSEDKCVDVIIAEAPTPTPDPEPDTKATVSSSYAKAKVTRKAGCKTFTSKLTNNSKVTVAYKSSNTKVATVDKTAGKVTVKGAGSATIIATFAGDADHEAASASYRLVAGLSKVMGVKTLCYPGKRGADASWDKFAGPSATRCSGAWLVASGGPPRPTA